MPIKVVLDAGHGRTNNPYPPQKGYYEGTQMWKLANYLKSELELYGIEVITTRPNINDNPSLLTRGQTAGKNKCDLFLSLHSNAPASATDTKPNGVAVYYSVTDSKNKVLSDKLGNKVAEIMETPFKGSHTRTYESNNTIDYYGVIRASAQSGCKCAIILEHGFHTNPKDSAFLIVDDNLKKLAVAEAEIIADYFGVKKPIKVINPLSEGEEAINYLVSKGRITSPQEWIDNLATVKNLKYLFIKWAKDVKELGK